MFATADIHNYGGGISRKTASASSYPSKSCRISVDNIVGNTADDTVSKAADKTADKADNNTVYKADKAANSTVSKSVVTDALHNDINDAGLLPASLFYVNNETLSNNKHIMKQTNVISTEGAFAYEAPSVERLDVQVEQGFAGSDFNDLGSNNFDDLDELFS